MTIHVTGATGFLGLELLRLAPEATGERIEIRDAAAVRAHSARARALLRTELRGVRAVFR